MKDQKKLAARMIADRLAEINAELDRELAAKEPDWDRVDQLSAEAAAFLVSEEQTAEDRNALIAVLPAAVPAKRKIQPMRWFRYAAAAAIAGVALFAVPAAIRHNLSIRREPTPTDSITTETTAVTGGTDLTTSVSVTESLIGSESSETKATASVSETQKTASSETTPETTGTVSESRQESRVTASSVTTAPTQPTYTVTSSTASSESQSGPAEHTAEYTTVPSETAPISSTTTTKWLAGLADSDRTTEPRIPSTPSIGDAEPFTIFSQPLVYVSIIEKQGAGSLQTVKMIPGVELQLLTLDKTVVCSWTSDGSEKELQLKADTPYYLHASSIPEGYVEPACDWFVMLRSGDIKGRQITFTLDRAEAKKEALT